MTDPTAQDQREVVCRLLHRDLIGPVNGPDETLVGQRPDVRYTTGMIFARESGADSTDDGTEEIAGTAGDADEVEDSPLAGMLQRNPASAGMTFSVSLDATLEVRVRAGTYEMTGGGGDAPDAYTRSAHEEIIDLPNLALASQAPTTILNGRAELWIRDRIHDDRRIVTATVVNALLAAEDERKSDRWKKALFQLEMEATCRTGSFREPPAVDVAVDEEERELRLRYRSKIAWAVGHCTSVRWDSHTEDPPKSIAIDFMPTVDVPQFRAGRRAGARYDESVLSIVRLAENDPATLRSDFDAFIDDFERWIEECRQIIIAKHHRDAFKRTLVRLDEQLARLRVGVSFICKGDEEIRTAFRMANEAILSQMEQVSRARNKSFDRSKPEWRPFQLAFQFLVIPGLVSNEGLHGREIVDLVWFPTGGGKTEAYLLSSAFIILYRRMKFGEEGAGTAVLTRYTLRLLTTQQFIRSATLVCALERMRSLDEERLGTRPIDIGLWIGGGSTPNKQTDAQHEFDALLDDRRPQNRFMLDACPWCGCSLLPEQKAPEEQYGMRFTDKGRFEFHCLDSGCEFHHRLPVQVVDHFLYEQPPSFLLGTIDKFAMLAWDGRGRAFFGAPAARDSPRFRPPDLVIQDELHLISGPLGTIAAVYESAIDVVLAQRGMSPKIVAATATMRGADTQARRLYARPVRVFPAPGVDADDSWFMEEDRTDGAPNRRYIGILGQAHSPVTNTVHTTAALLNAGHESARTDTFWTTLAYHNSRRELGKTMTLGRDDIPDRIKVALNPQPRPCSNVRELSGNIAGWEIPERLKELMLRRGHAEAVDLLPCTNMISVGVDVGRLNSMIVMGQPKTTAEYIQATSRVGRERDGAGLVLMNFSPTKPRDRSHFESFRRYHDALYRWVEPTSVTPESGPALDRALHAAVILAVRIGRLPDDEDAGNLANMADEDVADVRGRLVERLQSASGATEIAEARVKEIFGWWQHAIEEARSSGRGFRYRSEAQYRGLIRRFGSPQKDESKETLQSMRNVDGEVPTSVEKW